MGKTEKEKYFERSRNNLKGLKAVLLNYQEALAS